MLLCMALSLLPGTAAADDSDFVIEDGVLVHYIGPGGDVVIPNGITSIGDSAFAHCRNLTSVTIPDGVTRIGIWAFFECINLTRVTIPFGVTYIGSNAFYRCGSLTNVDIPSSVTFIGQHTFSGCKGITSVTIPSSAESLGPWAFSGCTNLVNVTILSSQTKAIIREGMFRDCSSMTSVTIPFNITGIRNSAFSGCNSLTDVYYTGSEAQWNNISIEDPNTNSSLETATIHYNSTGPSTITDTVTTTEYIYNSPDIGDDFTLPAEWLDNVTDTNTAIGVVQNLADMMSDEQKAAPDSIDLATLYAETAAAKASSQVVSGGDIFINAAVLSELAPTAVEASAAVESALINGGITTVRELSSTGKHSLI